MQTAAITESSRKVQGPETLEDQRTIFGPVAFHNVTMSQAIEAIDRLVAEHRPSMVVTPNVDHLIRARQDASYEALVARADLVLVDSQPLVWASRLAGSPLCERVAGSDLFPLLCGHAAKMGYRLFFLGGDPGAAESARDVLKECHPDLQVVGVHCPPFGFEKDEALRRQAVEAVRVARPDILFVALGSPKQERWIADHQHEIGPVVSLGVGISFSFIAGQVKRAPLWMRRGGLEWLHRVWQEPRRLAGRYFIRGWGLLPIVASEIWKGRVLRSRSAAHAGGRPG